MMNQEINYYRGKDCMKKFCEDLRIHAIMIKKFDIYARKNLIPLIRQSQVL